MLNKKICIQFSKLAIIVMITASVFLLNSMSTPVFASNRDFHTKDGKITYKAAEWKADVTKFRELLEAVDSNSANLMYEFGSKNYDYTKFEAALSIPGALFEDILKDSSLVVKEVAATPIVVEIDNGIIKVHFNNILNTIPNIADFAITQTVGTARSTTVMPIEITMDSTMTIATLTVPKVTHIALDQRVVYGISYKNSKIFSTTFVVSKVVPTIIAVKAPSDIDVVNGTIQANIGLPKTLDAIMSDNTTSVANVTWNSGTPFYNATTAGKYMFMGKVGANGFEVPIYVNILASKPTKDPNSTLNNQIRLNYKNQLTSISNKIENLKNNNTIRELMKMSDGSWQYVYTYDHDAVDVAQQSYDVLNGKYLGWESSLLD